MTFSSGDFVDNRLPSTDAGPVLVFHCYLSVPLMPSSFGMLHGWISARLSKPVTHWTILVDQWCDNYTIYCHKGLIPNSNVAFLRMDNYEGCISDIIRYYTGQYSGCPGTIVLITAKDTFPHIQELKCLGWKVIVVHPPEADVGLVDLGHVNHELPMHQPTTVFRDPYLTSWFCGRITQRVTLPKLSNPEPMVPLDPVGLRQFLRNFSSTTLGPNWRAAYPVDVIFKQSFEEFISETLACTAVRTVTGIIRDMMNADSGERMTVEVNKTMAPIGTERKKQDESDEIKTDETKTDELKTSETKTNDTKTDELKTEKVTLELKPKTQEEEKPTVVAQPKVDVAKPAPKLQCPKFHRNHHQREKCPNRHPRRNCEYYPRCRATAAHCGYAHPFCSKTKGYCKCPPTARNPQLNHNLE